MIIRKRLGALAMAAMLPIGGATLAAAVVVSTATPAFASGGDKYKQHATPHDCWDEGCNGLSPQTTGCSASGITVYTPTRIVDSGGTQLGTVELRYSRNCGANWSRTIAFSQFAGALTADIYNTIGQHEPTDFPEGSGTLVYSYMLGGANETDWACGSITWEGSGASACTASA